MDVAWEDYGTYATDIFTNEATKAINNHNQSQPLFLYLAHLAVHSANTYMPLQAPAEIVDLFDNIQDENRRIFAGMLYKLDESVGQVVTALKQNGMLENSVIVFTTDNGGPAAGFNQNAASNWPLKGVKDTLWEGGVRGSAFLWSPKLKRSSRVSNQMMNIEDWLPTLVSVAGKLLLKLNLLIAYETVFLGGDPSNLPSLDGLDMWSSLSEDTASPKNLMLHNIDESRHVLFSFASKYAKSRNLIYALEISRHYELAIGNW